MKEYTVKSHTAKTQREFLPHEGEKGLDKPMGFVVEAHGKNVGYFTLAPMPGCCGVVVSTGSFLQRFVASGRVFHELKAHVAKELGYSRMLATTQTKNFPELIGAAKNGWKLHEAFINQRTGEQLTVMEKAL